MTKPPRKKAAKAGGKRGPPGLAVLGRLSSVIASRHDEAPADRDPAR